MPTVLIPGRESLPATRLMVAGRSVIAGEIVAAYASCLGEGGRGVRRGKAGFKWVKGWNGDVG